MAKTRQAGQTGTARRWISLLAMGLSGLMTGCSSISHPQAPPNDPLYGVLVPPGTLPPTHKGDGGATAGLKPSRPVGILISLWWRGCDLGAEHG